MIRLKVPLLIKVPLPTFCSDYALKYTVSFFCRKCLKIYPNTKKNGVKFMEGLNIRDNFNQRKGREKLPQ